MVGAMSLAAHASTGTLDSTTSLSYTITTTTIFPVTTGGILEVNFDSIQLTNPPPQAYSFGVTAKTTPGNWITRLQWAFGDGTFRDVVYCCRDQVSEVQYHAYSVPGPYTVLVIAYDNVGNYGSAVVTVNWETPVPEYPGYAMPLVASLIAALVGAAYIKKSLRPHPLPTVTH